jgi:hypothetical protein
MLTDSLKMLESTFVPSRSTPSSTYNPLLQSFSKPPLRLKVRSMRAPSLPRAATTLLKRGQEASVHSYSVFVLTHELH